ncbi:dihydrodipicolinate reductase [Mycobacterium terramassiliense]|uniref:Dihydrodipicolinate reductase n=1 Tax=Mycobacterium terramassiliense TaxID=1841859 RepID=A0A2U3NGQ0_9MYCO|nr:dihydrodipicolinate reductase [Mycobacterium terramassiliense]SPM30614.1 dihydrodipicolinate reductase [Mycobacterium terramassiliense]
MAPTATRNRIKVFQVASGNVGSEMIRRIRSHPDLALVGLHCYSADKIGRDAGEIVGIPANGVIATGSVDDIIAARPDVVTFHGVFPDFDLYERVLEAGIDVVTTADWITGHHRDQNHPHPSGKPPSVVLEEACWRGGSTFYGTGMNPGLCHILGTIHTCDVANLTKVTVTESVDASCHHSVGSWQNCGFGHPINDPELPQMLQKGTRVYADGVYLMADCFGVDLDGPPTFDYELGACSKDIDLGWYFMGQGTLGACRIRYVGTVEGVPRVESKIELAMTPHTDPQIEVKSCYIAEVEGDPCIYSKHMIFPKPGTDFSSSEAFARVGMTVTGMPALNAIKAVVAAPPGCITSADLPLRAFAGRFESATAASDSAPTPATFGRR